MKTPDVIVIGGGIVGCSICYYLAKRGVQVTLVERNDLATGTTRAGQGGVGGGDALVRASAKLYSCLSDELGTDIRFTWNGGLNMLLDEKDIPRAELAIESMRAEGRDAKLLSRKDVRELEPEIADEVIGGVFFADSGAVDAFETTYSLSRVSAALGAEINLHTEVSAIQSSNRRVTGVTAGGDEIKTGAVILAAGLWTPELAEKMGITVPVTPRRGHLLVTESTPALESNLSVYQPFGVYAELRRLGKRAVDSDDPFIRQGVAWNLIRTGHNSYLIGSSRDFAGFDSSVRHDVIRTLAQQAVRFFPRFKHVSCIRAYSGWRQYTPDVKPIIGEVDTIKGLYVATGFEGEGIMLAPIVGKLLSEEIVDGTASMPLDEFRYSRFAGSGEHVS